LIKVKRKFKEGKAARGPGTWGRIFGKKKRKGGGTKKKKPSPSKVNVGKKTKQKEKEHSKETI